MSHSKRVKNQTLILVKKHFLKYGKVYAVTGGFLFLIFIGKYLGA